MEEKKYLKWYNKVGYGSGDIAGNVVFAFLSSFIMIYLTNTVGLNAGVIGSLIAASKVLDGISDVVFGSMIDRTHTKMGKARPWMLRGIFWMCNNIDCSIFCTNNNGKDISVCVVFYYIFVAKCGILYSK